MLNIRNFGRVNNDTRLSILDSQKKKKKSIIFGCINLVLDKLF